MCWGKQPFGPAKGDAACGSVVAHMLLVGAGGTVPPASLEQVLSEITLLSMAALLCAVDKLPWCHL